MVSLVSYWNVNGGGFVRLPDLLLAANGYGPANGQADVALGGPAGFGGAAILHGSFGTFQGLAVNNFAAALLPFSTIQVVTTVTAYADPANFEIIFELDPLLLDASGFLPRLPHLIRSRAGNVDHVRRSADRNWSLAPPPEGLAVGHNAGDRKLIHRGRG